jgi:citrate lyase beta subunit
MVRDGVHLINLPKPETAEQVREAAQRIAEAAQANGVAQVPGLLLNIETPRALRCAAELACAHASVAGLQMGLGDLFEPFGVNRRESAAIAQALFAVRMAAPRPASTPTTAPLPTSATAKASAPRRGCRAAWAFWARPAYIPARWRWPMRSTSPRRRKSNTH